MASGRHLLLLGTLVLGLGLTGCMSSPHAYAARADEVKKQRDNFGAGEPPVIVLRNYNGQTVSVEIRPLTGTGLLQKHSEFVPKDHNLRWVYLAPLETGSYYAVIKVSGDVKERVKFTVED